MVKFSHNDSHRKIHIIIITCAKLFKVWEDRGWWDHFGALPVLVRGEREGGSNGASSVGVALWCTSWAVASSSPVAEQVFKVSTFVAGRCESLQYFYIFTFLVRDETTDMTWSKMDENILGNTVTQFLKL